MTKYYRFKLVEYNKYVMETIEVDDKGRVKNHSTSEPTFMEIAFGELKRELLQNFRNEISKNGL